MKIPTTCLVLVALTACSVPEDGESDDNSTRIMGSIDGASNRSLDASAVAKVQGSWIDADGELMSSVDGSVGSDGEYTIDMNQEAGFGYALVEAFDADGEVVGMVIVEPQQDEHYASPINSETSVESEVFLALQADPDVWADVRSRVDADMAAYLWSQPAYAVDDLALSVRAGAAASMRAWSNAGLDLDMILTQRAEAAAKLSVDLYNRIPDAHDPYYDSLIAAEASAGATSNQLTEAKAASSVAFRTALALHGGQDLLDLGVMEAARVESEAWQAASATLLTEADVETEAADTAVQLSTSLEADLLTATDSQEAAMAIESWRWEMNDVFAESSGGVDLLGEITLDGLWLAIEAGAEANLQLADEIEAEAELYTSATGFDAVGFGETVADTMVQHRNELRSELQGTVSGDADLSTTLDILIDINTTFVGY